MPRPFSRKPHLAAVQPRDGSQGKSQRPDSIRRPSGVAFCLIFFGLVLMTVGVALIYIPGAFIMLGASFLSLGAIPDWGSGK